MSRSKVARSPAVERALGASPSASALARHLDIEPSAVMQWETIPPNRVPAVARFTGIPPEELWPELADAMRFTAAVAEGRAVPLKDSAPTSGEAALRPWKAA